MIDMPFNPADSSLVQVGYIEETTFSTTPGGTFQELRITGESLNETIETIASEELRSDRQVPDITKVDASSEGDLNFEFSAESFDDLMQGALFSTWSASASISTSADISFVDGNTITSSGSTTFGSAGFVVGQWIKVAGSSVAGNNSYFQIQSISTSGLSIDVLPATLTTSSTSTAVSITSQGMIRNGVTKRSYSIEKYFTDVEQYVLFKGQRVGGVELNFETGSIIGGSFMFMGTFSNISSATASSATYTPANGNTVLNAVDNLLVYKDGAPSTSYFQSLTMSLDNGLRPQKAIGTLGNVGIGAGRMSLTGSLSTYFEDKTWYDIFKNATPFALSFRLVDAEGNAMIVTMPRVKITSSVVTAEAIDEDVKYAMEFQAIRNPTTDCTIQIDRFIV